MTAEYICYVDETGRRTGETSEKLSAHTADTKRHLAFSIFLFDTNRRVLVTRRAAHKKVWPGVLTNSCCGHPGPGELIEDAIRRRCAYELGIEEVSDIICFAPDFTYISPLYNGIIENEFCPVYGGIIDAASVLPNPDEVSDAFWMEWQGWKDALNSRPEEYSFWCKQETLLIDARVQEYLEQL